MTLNYIGSKKSLLDFLETTILTQFNGKPPKSLGDGFCGTGCVGIFFSKKWNTHIHAVDIELYSTVITTTLLNIPYTNTLQQMIQHLQNLKGIEGLITKNYSPVGNRMYFTIENAQKIDAIRQEIDRLSITEKERIFLLASLISSADRVANVSCVYGAFLKKFKPSSCKPFFLSPIHTNEHITSIHTISRGDVVDMDWSGVDALYLDPPYNSRQYGANYFMLNYILEYKDKSSEMRPKTGLVDYYKSDFSKKSQVQAAFRALLKNPTLPNIIFISYNNEGLIKENDFRTLLEEFGTVQLYTKMYKKFKAQKTVHENHVQEYIWVLKRHP